MPAHLDGIRPQSSADTNTEPSSPKSSKSSTVAKSLLGAPFLLAAGTAKLFGYGRGGDHTATIDEGNDLRPQACPVGTVENRLARRSGEGKGEFGESGGKWCGGKSTEVGAGEEELVGEWRLNGETSPVHQMGMSGATRISGEGRKRTEGFVGR